MEAEVRLLGLSGQQGAGKDYTYLALREMLGEKARRMAFADGVRREVSLEVLSALGVDVGISDGAGQWRKPYTEGQRWILQQWGTEFRRAQDPDYWVNYGLEYIKERANPDDLWVVTDVRFANEAEAIRQAGGVVAQVLASVEDRAERLGLGVEALEARSNHASEVIDFTPDIEIDSTRQGLMADPALSTFLGLPANCIKCMWVQRHLFHDNGEVFEW